MAKNKGGSLSKKTINGKEYSYYQWYEDGKKRSRSISDFELHDIAVELNYKLYDSKEELKDHQFKTTVMYGGRLSNAIAHVKKYRARRQLSDITDYLNSEPSGKVLSLYGLRRTGKTTMMFQSISAMDIESFGKTAYIYIDDQSFDDLDDDLTFLRDHGFRYIFIDEVTHLTDFISRAAVLSDIYALECKIVLSGTDSLGFMIAKQNELYNRTLIIHTSYISYKEFSEVLGIEGIDKYIEFGGTMAVEGRNYNNVFSSGRDASEYVDTAIAHNIEHSLALYKDGDHFSSLYELHSKGELVNAVNRIVEDINHLFVKSTIEREFKSHDYGSLKDLLGKQPDSALRNALKNVNEDDVAGRLMKALDIIDKGTQKVTVDEKALLEIREYLNILDLSKEIEERNIVSGAVRSRDIFIQPGLRFCQAKELIKALFVQEPLANLNEALQTAIIKKLTGDVMGRMLEEIVLYQCSLAYPDRCFKLLFAIGEYDMVILDREEQCADIFEIKFSSITDENQYRFLIDDEKSRAFEERYYPIRSRSVLYRGENQTVDGISYINVEDYLKSLHTV